MSDIIIHAEDLCFTYPDGTEALAGISLSIERGEKVALLGPNGAGKSTLLLALCGVLEGRLHGRAELFGLPLMRENLPQVRKKLGIIFQNPDDQLFCPTVFDDVAFGPRNMKLSEIEVLQRTESALAAVGLANYRRRSSFHLSLGEKRRAAIATVLAMTPEALILDEPTSLLDGRGCRELLTLLGQIGGTQIIITHDLEFAARLCGRAVVMSRGKIIADGPAGRILADRPLLELHGLA